MDKLELLKKPKNTLSVFITNLPFKFDEHKRRFCFTCNTCAPGSETYFYSDGTKMELYLETRVQQLLEQHHCHQFIMNEY